VFTGIIEAALPVQGAARAGELLRIGIDLSALKDWQQVKLGDSVALNGCCLTVADLRGPLATFEAIPQTQRLTNLGGLSNGGLVNVERAMQAGARLDGHLVQGHVDKVAVVADIKPGDEWRIRVDCGADFAAQCVPRGSVCVDGISLTIAELHESAFVVAVIPHTREVTNIRGWSTGTQINLEADVIGKYVRRQLEQVLGAQPGGGVHPDALRKAGFIHEQT
jgi:riboflavin synthase